VTDGLFCIGDCAAAKGDVDADGNDQEAFDALQILLSVFGIPTDYDPIPICVADTNCSGVVTITDVVKVLQRSIGIDTRILSRPGEDPQGKFQHVHFTFIVDSNRAQTLCPGP